MDNYYDLLNEMQRSIGRAIRGPGAYTTDDTSPLRCEEVERCRLQSRAEIAALAKKLQAAGDIEESLSSQLHMEVTRLIKRDLPGVDVVPYQAGDIEGKATSQMDISR